MKRLRSREERKRVDQFLSTYFSSGALAPFSFIYGSRPSAEYLGEWQFSQETVRSDETRAEYVHTYVDPQTSLQVCCAYTVHTDYPAIEWLALYTG